MKKYGFTFLMMAFSLLGVAQQPPGTEIFLLDLSVKKSTVDVSNPQNITNRKGYDNQPYFHPNKPLLYYTSANADGKTDLVEYNFKTKKSRNITNTLEREYSPTVTPDKKNLSCIIQRDNGAQDLGKYPIDGGEPVVLISTLTVGYHAWIDQNQLLLFVLGDTITLHRYDVATKKDTILIKRIGRSLHKIPKSSAMSFVHKISEGEWIIKMISDDIAGDITTTLPGREDFTWTPDRKIIMSDGKKLFYHRMDKKSANWQEIEMPTGMPAGTLTRLAVNSKGNKLAIVISEE